MKKIVVFTDGGSRGNPGLAAIGIVICNEEENILKEYSQYLGDNLTNNEAEYAACIFALKKIKALFGKKKTDTFKIEVRSDSELLIKQMGGEYKIKEPKIQSLFLELWNLKIDFGEVNFRLISRNDNKEADRLVNEALNSEQRSQKLFPIDSY